MEVKVSQQLPHGATSTVAENDEPRSRQAAALRMGRDVEHTVMTMLKGDNPDWQDFTNKLSRSARNTTTTSTTTSPTAHDYGTGIATSQRSTTATTTATTQQ